MIFFYLIKLRFVGLSYLLETARPLRPRPRRVAASRHHPLALLERTCQLDVRGLRPRAHPNLLSVCFV